MFDSNLDFIFLKIVLILLFLIMPIFFLKRKENIYFMTQLLALIIFGEIALHIQTISLKIIVVISFLIFLKLCRMHLKDET